MDTITIPSPTAFLTKSPVIRATSIKPAPAQHVKPAPKKQSEPSTSKGSVLSGSNSAGIAKPKQSKSRNGCITCKTKRLKCDETKPTCQQCHKRNVTCGGYKKDFKWRSFEETTFGSKPLAKEPKKAPTPPPQPATQKAQASTSRSSPSNGSTPTLELDSNYSTALPSPSAFHPPQAFLDYQGRTSLSTSPTMGNSMFVPQTYPQSSYPQDQFRQMNGGLQGMGMSPEPDILNFENAHELPPLRPSVYSSSSSPNLIDLLLPGTEMSQPPPPMESRPPDAPTPYQPSGYTPPGENMNIDDEIEEVVRSTDPAIENTAPIPNGRLTSPAWTMRAQSPTLSDSSNSSSGPDVSPFTRSLLKANSQEMLMVRFDRQTCGILSIKDGPTENPWRTWIWPLARESPALFHAISSMTAFHSSREQPELRVDGVDHMRKSIRSLASSLGNMSLDSALATTLVLAFSESWDQHISTGIQHLRGAKALVNNALVKHRSQGAYSSDNMARMRFLCNTWIYMDVIARLTTFDDDDYSQLDDVMVSMNGHPDNHEIDPLLGCAVTLFPLIGRAANLIGKVRKTDTNSFTIISQAIELKTSIEQWETPSPMSFDNSEDPTTEIQHSIQTAEAYRWATLLYLHQAVPEIPSEPAGVLARKVLTYLATVPTSSRATIVHIYPLLAASCEASNDEDRQWVEDRWMAIARRLCIGNVDKCIQIVQEVWRRRDLHEAEKTERVQRRERNRVVMPPPTTAGLSGEKRKAFSADDIGTNSFTSGTGTDLEHPAIPYGPKRRATGDGLAGPVPIRLQGQQDMSNPYLAQPTATPLRKRSNDIALENMDFEYTVRGRLHWVGVMTEWRWEVLLG